MFDQGPNQLYHHQQWTWSWPNDVPLINLYYYSSCRFYYQSLEFLRASTNFIVKYRLAPSHLLWYFDFVRNYNVPVSPSIPFSQNYLTILKLFPILADILIAFILYKLTKSYLLPAIFLFSPFSWYISALWGQTDPLAFLFILLSFIFYKTPSLSSLLFFISFSLKPTSFFLIPLFLYIYFRQKPKLISIIISISLCLLITYITISVFNISPDKLIQRILNRIDALTINSYNFWHIFVLDHPPKTSFFTKTLSFIFYLLLNLQSFKILNKKLDLKSIFSALFIISFGSWLFLTNMLDRYAFIGIVSGLFLCFYYPKILKYWIPLSLIFWLNLFRSWWFPSFLWPLKDILTYRQAFAGLPLSLLNLFFFLKIVHHISIKNPPIKGDSETTK